MAQHLDHILRLSDLASSGPTAFDLQPDAAARAALAQDLGIVGIKKLRFCGQLSPRGKRDWQLQGDLGVTVVQDCVITLAPVTTRLDEKVLRNYLTYLPEPDGSEVEMPEDDTSEAIPAQLDLFAVLREALALALPAFPRAVGAQLGQMVYAAPGVAPLTDEAAKPFAGLDALRSKLGKAD